jgi:hypothetical protein
MGLTALQSHSELKATPHSTEWCEIGRYRPLANCCPVAQAIAYSFIVARQITFRNKIPTAVSCGRSVFHDPRALEPKGPGGVLRGKAVVADDETGPTKALDGSHVLKSNRNDLTCRTHLAQLYPADTGRGRFPQHEKTHRASGPSSIIWSGGFETHIFLCLLAGLTAHCALAWYAPRGEMEYRRPP